MLSLVGWTTLYLLVWHYIRDDWAIELPNQGLLGRSLPKCFFPRGSDRRILLIVGVCYTSSHLHISSSHVHIYTFHLHIFTSSHITFASSHLLIFTSPHIIFTSSHLITHLVLTYHLRIFTSTHIIFTSSHLHIFSLSLPLSLFLPLSLPPSLSLSLPLSLSFSPLSGSLSFFCLFSLKAAGGADKAPQNGHPFARNEVRSPKTEVKLWLNIVGGNPFAQNEGRSSKTDAKLIKIAISHCRRQPFRTKVRV